MTISLRVAITSDLHAGYSEKTAKIHDEFFSNLNNQSWDVLVLAGDLSSTKTKHLKGFANRIRSIITRPILCIRGNHDLWEKENYNLKKTIKDTELIFAEKDIHLLSNGNQKIINDVGFFGWDGWYNNAFPNTNDQYFMPNYTDGIPTGIWLHKYEDNEFKNILTNIDQYKIEMGMSNIIPKVVCVTHMPIFEHPTVYNDYAANQRYFEFLKNRADVLCYGHTHSKVDEIKDGIRIINSGSDYDNPKYSIFEI